MIEKNYLHSSTHRTLYAIIFTDKDGKEWVDSTPPPDNENSIRFYLKPDQLQGKISLPSWIDAYLMKETAQSIANGRGVFRIIEVKEIIEPAVMGYKIIQDENCNDQDNDKKEIEE